MLFRFSLYGFLKNQRYFEPFLVLALLDKGLSFFAIGSLIAFREISTNALEIPSGSIADLLGRRRSMLVSCAAYVCSFVTFWLAHSAWILWPAMALFSVGEAFRTGTHKAMIFEWLRLEGRTDEKVKIYGHTRSFSKLGSAVSVLIGGYVLFWLDSYPEVFLLSAIPVTLNFINLASYPRILDGNHHKDKAWRAVWRHSITALNEAVRRPHLRRLLAESMAFEGVFHASKDYLQPLLATAAVTIVTGNLAMLSWNTEGWSDLQRATLVIAPVYFLLFLLSAIASRRSHQFVTALGGSEERASRCLWAIALALFVALFIGEWACTITVSIAAFVALHVAQNLWRPILISRFGEASSHSNGAVTLSIESQGRRLSTMILAPIFGLAIDTTNSSETVSIGIYWPIAAVGILLATTMLFLPSIRQAHNP
jgi:MFS family permease